MAVIVATRTKVRKARFLPKFLGANIRIALQARQTQGFRGGRLRVEPTCGFASELRSLHHPNAAHESRVAAPARRFGIDIPIRHGESRPILARETCCSAAG